MKKLVILSISLLFLSGCAVANKMKAQSDMVNSKDAYKSCLIANPDNPDKCEGLRRAYEADLQANKQVKNPFRRSLITIEQE